MNMLDELTPLQRRFAELKADLDTQIFREQVIAGLYLIAAFLALQNDMSWFAIGLFVMSGFTMAMVIYMHLTRQMISKTENQS